MGTSRYRTGLGRQGTTVLGTHWRSLLTAACAAPSLHNSQPWRFVVGREAIELHLDPERTLPVADRDLREARISCGAALLNLRVAARARDLLPRVTLLPHRGHPTLLATVRLVETQLATPLELAMDRAIPRRRSHRRPFHPAPIPPPLRQRLAYAAGQEGGYLRIVDDPPMVAELAALVRRADHQQRLDPAYQAEQARWSTTDSTRTDGVPVTAGGPRPSASSLLALRDFGQLGDVPDRDFEADPLLAVLLSPGDTHRDQLRCGQAMQLTLLTATDLGVGTSILGAPTEQQATRAVLRTMLGGAMAPQLVLRFGIAVPAGPAAPRRPIDDMVDHVHDDPPGSTS